MSGVVVARQVLVSYADLVVLVPATRIGAGVLPLGTPLPGISLESVSRVERRILGNSAFVHVTERVQVTVLANDYDSQQTVQVAVRKAIRAARFPVVAGLEQVTIHVIGANPDFMNTEASIFMGSDDLRVTFSEPR